MPEFHTADALAPAYRGIRRRVRAAVEGATPEQLLTRCPATPEWTVHDVVAHLCGVPADVLAGRMDGVATDAWTAVQVEERRSTPTAALLDAWDADGDAVEPLMGAFPPVALGQFVYDAVTHECDIVAALGGRADRSSDAIACSFDWALTIGARSPRAAVRLELGDDTIVWGDGDPVATLAVSRFDVVRLSCGRRTADEIRGYVVDGSIDPEALLLAPFFSLATTSLAE